MSYERFVAGDGRSRGAGPHLPGSVERIGLPGDTAWLTEGAVGAPQLEVLSADIAPPVARGLATVIGYFSSGTAPMLVLAAVLILAAGVGPALA